MFHPSTREGGRPTAAAPVPQGCPFTPSRATRLGGLDRGDRDTHHLPHLPRSVTAGAKMAVPGGEVPRHVWKRILQVHVTLERGRASAHSSGTAAPCPGSRGEMRAVTLRGDTGSLPAAPPCLEVESLQPPAGTERPGRFLDHGSSADKAIWELWSAITRLSHRQSPETREEDVRPSELAEHPPETAISKSNGAHARGLHQKLINRLLGGRTTASQQS